MPKSMPRFQAPKEELSFPKFTGTRLTGKGKKPKKVKKSKKSKGSMLMAGIDRATL